MMGAVREYAAWYGGAEGGCGKACEEGDDTEVLHSGDVEIVDGWCRRSVGRAGNARYRWVQDRRGKSAPFTWNVRREVRKWEPSGTSPGHYVAYVTCIAHPRVCEMLSIQTDYS